MQNRSIVIIIGCIIWSFTGYLHAQEEQKHGGFGGPDQVERQLEDDKASKTSLFDLGFMQTYLDFKKNLKEKTGLDFGLDYSAAYFNASQSLGYNEASSGMVRLYGSWNLTGKDVKNSGALVFKAEHRHKYGHIPPKSLGFETGYVGLIEPPFSNDKFRLTNFYWRQHFLDGRISLALGLLDATDYVDVYALASPWMHFMNFAFSTGSETIYIPNDAALGIAIAGYLTEHIYSIAGISDAGSDPTTPLKSFDTFFSNNDYFKSIELGWVSSKDRHFYDNIHLTYWHSDGSEVTASLPGWGLAFSGTYYINDKFMPFIRGGYANDGGTLLQKSVVGGLGYQAKSGGNLLGAAIGWGEVNESTWVPDLDDQITMELFYRLQFSTRFSVTPDVQFLINPALSDASTNFIWGLRSRITL